MAKPATLFPFSERSRELQQRVATFIAERIEPAESVFAAHAADPASRWSVPPLLESLKAEARAQGLWNLFLPDPVHGA